MEPEDLDPEDLDPKDLMSIPAANYWENTIDMMHFIVASLANRAQMLTLRRQMIDWVAALPPDLGKQLTETTNFAALAAAAGKGGAVADALGNFNDFVYELVFCRVVDYFLIYISELLALIFRAKPEALKSDEKVSVEMILEYSTREDLIEAIMERKVLNLSFQGFFALNDTLTRQLKFPLLETESQLEIAIELIENRNLYVHNKGIVNRRYLERVPKTTLKVGDHLPAAGADPMRAWTPIWKLVTSIDRRAGAKFGIPRNENSQAHSKKHDDFEKIFRM